MFGLDDWKGTLIRAIQSVVLASYAMVSSAVTWTVGTSDTEPFQASRGTYETITDACVGEAARLADPKDAGVIAKWCLYRAHHSSRGGNTIVSAIDGSQVHDRDRPLAHVFYRRLLQRGIVDPDKCVHHEAPFEKHPKECHELAANWPYRSPRMTDELKLKWLGHHHGYERFSTRGPLDNTAYSYITMANDGFSTCWPIWWLDDNGVAAEVTVRRAIQRCRNLKRCTFASIKEAW